MIGKIKLTPVCSTAECPQRPDPDDAFCRNCTLRLKDLCIKIGKSLVDAACDLTEYQQTRLANDAIACIGESWAHLSMDAQNARKREGGLQCPQTAG